MVRIIDEDHHCLQGCDDIQRSQYNIITIWTSQYIKYDNILQSWKKISQYCIHLQTYTEISCWEKKYLTALTEK